MNDIDPVVSTTPGDSDIQTSKETTEHHFGTLCGVHSGAVRSHDNQNDNVDFTNVVPQRMFTLSDERYSQSKSTVDQTTSLRSTLTGKSSSGHVDITSGMPDMEIVRLGSQPLREVTEILSNLAGSLYHIQSSKEPAKCQTDNVVQDPQPLVGVRRALSSLSNFLSLQRVESEPLSELYRAVSQLFKLYSEKFTRSRSEMSTQSAKEASAVKQMSCNKSQTGVLNPEDIEHVVNEAQQCDLKRIALDLKQARLSSESISSTGDRLCNILERFDAEDIHLEESDILLDLIESLIDHIVTLTPDQVADKERRFELNDAVRENNRDHEQTFEDVSRIVQETLHNVADELMHMVKYHEMTQLTQTEGESPCHMSSLHSSQFELKETVTTQSESAEWGSSSHAVKLHDAATQKPSNIAHLKTRGHANLKTEIGYNTSISQPVPLGIVDSVSGSNVGTGAGARPKVPSKPSKHVANLKTRHKRCPSKKHNDSKYSSSSRVSQQSSPGKQEVCSTTSSSTMTVCSETTCDMYDSLSVENLSRPSLKSSKKEKQKRRSVKTQVEKHAGKVENRDKSTQEIPECENKFSQKPSTPVVYIDRGSSAIDFTMQFPSADASGGTEKEDVQSSEHSDIVQKIIRDVMYNLKKSTRRVTDEEISPGGGMHSSKSLRQTMSDAASFSASVQSKEQRRTNVQDAHSRSQCNRSSTEVHKENLSHMSLIIRQILSECENNNRKISHSDVEKEDSKSTQGIRARSFSKDVHSMEYMETKSEEILCSLISEVVHAIIFSKRQSQEKESKTGQTQRTLREIHSAVDHHHHVPVSCLARDKTNHDTLSTRSSTAESREQSKSTLSTKSSLSNILSRFLSNLLQKISKRSNSSMVKSSNLESSGEFCNLRQHLCTLRGHPINTERIIVIRKL